MELKELKGWDTFRKEPSRPIGYISREVSMKHPEKDVKTVDVLIYSSDDDVMRAQISFSGYCEIWSLLQGGRILADYIEDTGDETLQCVEAGPIETREPIESLEDLAEFVIEYAEEIDVVQFWKAYHEAMGTPTCSECGRPVNTETVPDADYYICEVCEKTITDHPGAGIVSRVGA